MPAASPTTNSAALPPFPPPTPPPSPPTYPHPHMHPPYPPPHPAHPPMQGVVKEPTFKKFVREEVATPAAARAWLEARGVGHYWDAAAHYDPDAAPQPDL